LKARFAAERRFVVDFARICREFSDNLNHRDLLRILSTADSFNAGASLAERTGARGLVKRFYPMRTAASPPHFGNGAFTMRAEWRGCCGAIGGSDAVNAALPDILSVRLSAV
jgi:hypothetical protein